MRKIFLLSCTGLLEPPQQSTMGWARGEEGVGGAELKPLKFISLSSKGHKSENKVSAGFISSEVCLLLGDGCLLPIPMFFPLYVYISGSNFLL